jgi:hypothetical protein
MKRTAAVVVVGAVVAVVAAVIVAGSAGGQGGGQTIVLRELQRGAIFGFVDNPPKSRRRGVPRLSPGDLTGLSVRVADSSGKPVGRLDVTCMILGGRTRRTARQVCHGGVTLSNGFIGLQATLVGINPRTARAAVTGGTGSFIGARGQLTSVTRNRVSVDTIELRP